MGCDIHAVMEVRKPGGKWLIAKRFDLPRWYQMFGALVGGHARWRDYEGKVPGERGLPPDASEHAMYLGDHTYSWLTPDEWEAATDLVECDNPDSTVLQYRWPLSYCREKEEDGLEARLVFGFDS